MKYYTVAWAFDSNPLALVCGESCIAPFEIGKYRIFTQDLKPSLSESQTPCEDAGYTRYKGTENHGVPGMMLALDMYQAPGDVIIEPGTDVKPGP